MNGHRQSDGPVVPANPPNKATAAEVGEGRGSTKGNTTSKPHPGRSAGPGVSHALDRVRQAAARDKKARFTALLHHVGIDRLRAAYRGINPKAAPGVDEVTWAAYGQDLENNLRDLHRRVHSGAYRASPSRRAYIPKADGRLRPLGIATQTFSGYAEGRAWWHGVMTGGLAPPVRVVGLLALVRWGRVVRASRAGRAWSGGVRSSWRGH